MNVSQNLPDLVSQITQDDDARTIYCVRYRGADRFVLAEGEDEAVAAVARELGVVAGIVPAAALIAAARVSAGQAPTETKVEPAKPAAKLLNLSFPDGIPS